MIEDSVKPWYFSSDHLYRPLRNAVLHSLPGMFGTNPVPYRTALLLCALASLVVFFVLLRQLRVPREGCLTALTFAALYPRRQEVYYFWAASQDAVMAFFSPGIGFVVSLPPHGKPGIVVGRECVLCRFAWLQRTGRVSSASVTSLGAFTNPLGLEEGTAARILAPISGFRCNSAPLRGFRALVYRRPTLCS